MKKEFPGYFSGAAADIEKLWDECVFVLDANVLLNLYRYSDFTCSKLLDVFNSLSDRLWVPHQVVYEYLNNRLGVISDQGKLYDDAVKKVDSLRKILENHNQHPFITENTLTDSLQVFDRVVCELSENKSVYEKRINADEIKDKLEILLEGKVGAAFTREQLDKIIVDGKGRYEQKIPPGFCDVKKGGDSIVFTDICRPYGDYIVWLQIIDHAKTLNKSVVFITGDTKDDWWASFQGKTLGPHPQLVQEFLLLVEKDFYMYLPDRFLERASEYLKQDGSEQAVNEIRDVREEDLESAAIDKAINVEWPKSPGVNIAWPKASEINTHWPRTGRKWYENIGSFGRVKPLRPVWYYNEGDLARNSELDHVSMQVSSLQERVEQVRARLDSLLTERENILALQKSLFASGVSLEDDRFNGCRESLSVINTMIEAHEKDFSMLRVQIRDFIAHRHSLLNENDDD